MGHFYTNFIVKDSDLESVKDLLQDLSRECFVYQATNNLILIYDSACESQDSSQIQELGEKISNSLHTTVIASLNHDDDQLILKTFVDGELADIYNSSPGLWGNDTEVMGGDPKLLAETLGIDDVASFDRILRQEGFAFAFQRHMAIVDLGGLPTGAFVYGWTDIKRKDADPAILQGAVEL